MSRTPTAALPRRRGREGVLTAAAALFRERGYDATSMQDVADRMGVTKAALYRHVGGKEELLHAVSDPVRTELLALVERSARDGRRGIELLAELLHGLASATGGDHCLVWRAREGPEAAVRDAVLRGLAHLLATAAEEGDVRRGLDPRVAAPLLLGAVTELGGPPRSSPSRTAVAVLLDGLATRRVPPPSDER